MPDSQKRERTQLARLMRAQGKTWVEIADFFRARYRINARVAFRYAHGWSQERAAQAWCSRWPDDLKTLKHFSYWEVWPASTGHAPSLTVLSRLAELYECSVSDLLIDMPNYRERDDAHQALVAADTQRTTSATQSALDTTPTTQPAILAGDVLSSKQADTLFLDLLLPSGAGQRLTSLALSSATTTLAEQLQAVNFDELVQVIVMWAHQSNPNINRRDVLAKLSAAFTVAAVAPLFDVLDVDERQHVGRFLAQDWSDFDEPTLRYCEAAITNLNRQADVLGPRLTLDSVMGHRQLAYRLAHVAPATFQQRAISAYAEFSRLTGWLCFNLGEYDSATHYYEDARTSAHDAHNVELVTFVLCAMSQLATCRGKPRIGIDHAAAAAVWAEQIDSPHARAYAADVAVRAYIADNQPHRSRTTLDHEYAALQTIRSNEPVSRWWYFYDESFYWRTEAEQALKLQQPETALQAVNKSLALIDPAYLHGSALRLLFRAEARIQQQEITEAATIIGNVAQLTATSKSQRVSERIIELRTTLTDWERTKPVRELDDRLKTYRSVHGNGNTKRTYSR